MTAPFLTARGLCAYYGHTQVLYDLEGRMLRQLTDGASPAGRCQVHPSGSAGPDVRGMARKVGAGKEKWPRIASEPFS